MNPHIETLKRHEKLHADSVACYRNMLAGGRCADVAREQLAYHEPFLAAIRAAIALMTIQQRVRQWLTTCFGPALPDDKVERNHRFLEESLELVQACGCTRSEAHQLVDYVFGRPVGEREQEVGGVFLTLAGLCGAQRIDMLQAGEKELERAWLKIEQIRAKQAEKPKHSPPPSVSETENEVAQ